MKNQTFYATTKGQLVTIWIFGLAGTTFSFTTADEQGDAFFGFLGIAILFFLFFYTIGWRANKKINN